MKKLLTLLAGLTLILAVAFVIYAQFQPEAEPRYENQIADMLPSDLDGWTVNDLDLGPTESITEASKNILRLDDFVYRNFRQGDLNFSVYVAYWRPGKMPLRLVQQHTPDRCWLENGWSCSDRDWNVIKAGPQGELPPAQWGIYEIRDNETYTYFWHFVDGEAYWPEVGTIRTRTSILNFFKEFFTFGLELKREQIFIRINSNQPFERVWDTRGFQKVIESLEPFGL